MQIILKNQKTVGFVKEREEQNKISKRKANENETGKAKRSQSESQLDNREIKKN